MRCQLTSGHVDLEIPSPGTSALTPVCQRGYRAAVTSTTGVLGSEHPRWGFMFGVNQTRDGMERSEPG